MSITTKNGDKGYTSLLNNERVLKNDIRIKLLGEIDELSSYLGLVKSEAEDKEIENELCEIQKNLSTVMAQIAVGTKDKYFLSKDALAEMERLIEKYEGMYISPKKFIIPGKNKVSASMDVCRTIARKAERRLIAVDGTYPVGELEKTYLNRISDYLYALARYTDFKEEITSKVKESLFKPGVSPIRNKDKLLNLSLAKSLMDKIENKAKHMELPVVIAISNEWGNIIAVHFMDGALPGSYDIAVNKAYTSAVLRMSTSDLGSLAKDGQSLQGIQNTNNNRIVIFGGGCPFKVNSSVVGALGISGGTAQQDTELALYGLKLFEEGL